MHESMLLRSGVLVRYCLDLFSLLIANSVDADFSCNMQLIFIVGICFIFNCILDFKI